MAQSTLEEEPPVLNDKEVAELSTPFEAPQLLGDCERVDLIDAVAGTHQCGTVIVAGFVLH